TTDDQQRESPIGIRVQRCTDVEISNMEIHGFGGTGISVQNVLFGAPARIDDFGQVRIHDNFIHHNQHPSVGGIFGGTALGYGVETANNGARAAIFRNVFDFNRHAIAAGFDAGGYIAEDNLVLKGGGWHGGFFNDFTHIFDAHGSGCWWSHDLCGDAGEEFRYFRNSFQYHSDKAIHIRGKPRDNADISENVFPHDHLGGWDDYAIKLYTEKNVEIGPGNIVKTDTYGKYYSQCDFDGDGIDDLFLATGATWWFSSSGKFHWTFFNTSPTQLKDLRFGYFDDDDRCDVITESGSGRWMISSGGTEPFKPLEQVWPESPPMDGPWRPLKDVQFGRFDPDDTSRSRRTTHAFYRKENGEWWVKKL